MNKFLKLTQTLIKNKLWASEVEFYKVKLIGEVSPVKEITFVSKLVSVIKNVDKSLVDGINVLNTDYSLVIDALSLNVIPETNDILKLNGESYKIIYCKPLGILENQPTAYELVFRLA